MFQVDFQIDTGIQGAKVIINRFGVLLAQKQIDERRRIPLSEVAKATGITWRTLQSWQSNTVTRFDEPVLSALCRYFGVQPGELLHYAPNEDGIDYDDTPNEARGGLSDNEIIDRALSDIG